MENKILDTLLTRKSVRRFKADKIPQEIVDQLTAAGQQAPSSVNGQQISLIVTDDAAQIEKISVLCGGQPQVKNAPLFILVVADFNRPKTGVEIEGDTFSFANSIEGLVTGAVDVGITASTIATAAESFGLGSTMIGGIRGQLAEAVEFFELPKYTVPMLGMIVGYPDPAVTNLVKPRFPKEGYAFNGVYPKIDFVPLYAQYEETLAAFRGASGQDDSTFTSRLAGAYGLEGRVRDNAETYEKQGFKLK